MLHRWKSSNQSQEGLNKTSEIIESNPLISQIKRIHQNVDIFGGGRGVSSLLNKGESLCNTYSSLCSSHMFSQRPGCIMGPTRACLDRAPDLLKSTSKAMQVCCEIWHWQGVSPSTVPSRTGSGIQVYAWQAHGDFGLTTWPGQCEERKALLAPDGHPQPRPFSPNPTVQ